MCLLLFSINCLWGGVKHNCKKRSGQTLLHIGILYAPQTEAAHRVRGLCNSVLLIFINCPISKIVIDILALCVRKADCTRKGAVQLNPAAIVLRPTEAFLHPLCTDMVAPELIVFICCRIFFVSDLKGRTKNIYTLSAVCDTVLMQDRFTEGRQQKPASAQERKQIPLNKWTQ